MSDDLIKRAREAAEPWDYGEPDTIITELADRIEAQAAELVRIKERLGWRIEEQAVEIERLREALHKIANESSDTWARRDAGIALAGKAEQ